MTLTFEDALKQMKVDAEGEKTRQKYLHCWRDVFEGKDVLIEEKELEESSMFIGLGLLRAMQGHQVQFFTCSENTARKIQHIMNTVAIQVNVHFSKLKVRVPWFDTDCDADTVVYYGLPPPHKSIKQQIIAQPMKGSAPDHLVSMQALSACAQCVD